MKYCAIIPKYCIIDADLHEKMHKNTQKAQKKRRSGLIASRPSDSGDSCGTPPIT